MDRLLDDHLHHNLKLSLLQVIQLFVSNAHTRDLARLKWLV